MRTEKDSKKKESKEHKEKKSFTKSHGVLQPSPLTKYVKKMMLKNVILQISIVILGIVSTLLGIKTMLQTPPLFFKTWFMVLISFSIIFVLALGFGLLIKLVLKSSWYSFTFTAILLTLYGLPYYLNEYKYSYTIYIPDHYVGNVRLFLSRNNKNDLFINDFGIGYISYRTFNKGFMPTIVKNRSDITNQIDGMGKGIYPANFNEKYVLDHLKFTVPGATENREVVDFDQLVIQNAIDTSRLQRK